MRNYFFEYIMKEHHSFKEQGLFAIWLNFFSILANVTYAGANPIISLFEEYRQRQIADGADPSRTKLISYGVDFAHYKFLNKPSPNQIHPVLACIGRVVPIKDVKTFIRACALIIQKIPGAEGWIVGPTNDDEDYVDSCQSLIAMLGLENKIRFLGMQHVMDIFPKIDLLLLSSISEGSPFVILESFAVGIPVVATNVGGCHELIYGKDAEDQASGSAGRLVHMADPNGLANAALELLTSQSAWVQAQQIGLARIRKYYSMEQLVKNYRSIYEEAMTWPE